jgi:Rod binding domain-containing protein
MSIESISIRPANIQLPKEEHKSLEDKSGQRELQLREKAREMEGLFIMQIVKAMEKTIPEGSLTGGKNSLPAMLFAQTMSDTLSKMGGFGLSDTIYQSLKEKDQSGNLQDLKEVQNLDTETYLKSIEMMKQVKF